jgi:hypothetical protein
MKRKKSFLTLTEASASLHLHHLPEGQHLPDQTRLCGKTWTWRDQFIPNENFPNEIYGHT